MSLTIRLPPVLTIRLPWGPNKKKVKLLGTGRPLREFIHAEDLASAIYFCLKIKKSIIDQKFKLKLPILNVGSSDEISIKKLAHLIAKFLNFRGKIIFDKKSPDGTFRKKLDSSIINKLGWSTKINFVDGLKRVIENRKK